MSRREDRSPSAEPRTALAADRRVVHESLGEDFEAEAGRAILDTGLELGLDMAYGCRVGACGACAVEIVEGLENVAEPDVIEQDALERYDLPPHVRLACRACVNGPIVIRTLEE